MNQRWQRESFVLGLLMAGLLSFSLVILASLLPVFDTDDAPTPEALAGNAAPTTMTDLAQGGGPPDGRGPGRNANPLAFGTADPEIQAAFDTGGCVACHSIKGIGGDGANVGPPLMRTGAIAADRRPGPSPEAYIEESILDPDAFIMPNCPTGPCASGVMPQTYAETLTSDQITTMVEYLAALGTADEQAVLSSR